MSARRRFRLRARLLVACGLLILTTVAASGWTLAALARLSTVAGTLVRQSDETTAALSELSSALEREDDALLFSLSNMASPREHLSHERHNVDLSAARLRRVLANVGERKRAEAVENRMSAYRAAVDRLLLQPGGDDSLERYHRDANPLLRLAVAEVSQIRDQYFTQTQQALAKARDEVTRARGIVLVIAAGALGFALLIALRLARDVIRPLRQLAEGANAIQEGNFDARISCEPGDEIAEVAGAFNDMAERLAEFRRVNLEEILRVKAALEATLMALPDAVVLLDADGQVASGNPAAAALFRDLGVPAPADVRGLEDIGVLQPGLFALSADDAAPSVSVNLSSALRLEARGEIRQLLPRVRRTAREADGRSGVVVVFSDVSELARLDEMRAEHIAVASHELRTPVTTLRMTLLMLQEGAAALPLRIRELLSTSLVGVAQLEETVDELLDLTRIEAGRLRLHREPVALPGLIEEAFRRARPRAEDIGVSLRAFVEPDLPLLLGDRTRLRVVLDNLLNNALKYTSANGSVTVSAELMPMMTPEAARRLRIHVMDTGSGVPEALRARIFEKFFRVEHHRSDTEEGARGAGIGLYLCKEIIELHEGSIRCEAGEDGQGTRIIIELPAVPPRSSGTSSP